MLSALITYYIYEPHLTIYETLFTYLNIRFLYYWKYKLLLFPISTSNTNGYKPTCCKYYRFVIYKIKF